MEDIKVGILGGGFQGKSEAFWFAKRNVNVIVYEISQGQRDKIYEEIASSAKGQKYEKYIKLTGNIEDLSDCNLIIENVPENREIKCKMLSDIEKIVSDDTVIASNSSSYLPTFLADSIEKKDRFINIHFLGVSWGIHDLELIPSKYTSKYTLEVISKLLYDVGFNPIVVKECPGFVFNRINGMELSSLFRAMEQHNLTDIDTIAKYLLYPIRGQWTVAFIDLLGVEISKALIDYLYEKFGDRVFISNYLNGRVERNELGAKTGKGFYEYPNKKVDPTILIKKPIRNVKSKYNKIFVNNVYINQLNFLLALINKGKQVYMDSVDIECFNVLESVNKSMYERIVQSIILSNNDCEKHFDLIIDSKVLPFEQVIKSIDQLSERFGEDAPIAFNTPIYKFEDIAKSSKHPSEKIAVFNCQKSYICNTELVRSDAYNKSTYEEIKKFIIELTGDCLEVNDGYTRPLMFLLISKIFETIRCLEEGITSRDNIVRLMQKEEIFRDTDYMGLDKLKFIADYLYDVYGQPFEVPNLLNHMVKEQKHGVMNGIGFYDYNVKN